MRWLLDLKLILICMETMLRCQSRYESQLYSNTCNTLFAMLLRSRHNLISMLLERDMYSNSMQLRSEVPATTIKIAIAFKLNDTEI